MSAVAVEKPFYHKKCIKSFRGKKLYGIKEAVEGSGLHLKAFAPDTYKKFVAQLREQIHLHLLPPSSCKLDYEKTIPPRWNSPQISAEKKSIVLENLLREYDDFAQFEDNFLLKKIVQAQMNVEIDSIRYKKTKYSKSVTAQLLKTQSIDHEMSASTNSANTERDPQRPSIQLNNFGTAVDLFKVRLQLDRERDKVGLCYVFGCTNQQYGIDKRTNRWIKRCHSCEEVLRENRKKRRQ